MKKKKLKRLITKERKKNETLLSEVKTLIENKNQAEITTIKLKYKYLEQLNSLVWFGESAE